ncbi:MAG TPA: LysR family transcriptional regulator [Devosiaceae bacterium]
MRDLDMQTFVTLARTRHFGRTAEQMHTTQPAISSRLASLEAELGCQLVNRRAGEFRLTIEGERVLQGFLEILGTIEKLREIVRNPEGQFPEVVRIGAIDSVASTWMPGVVDSLHQTVPNLRVELIVEGTQHLVQDMERGDLDLIFCLDPAIGDGLRTFNACVWEMIWAGSPKLIDPGATYDVDQLAQMPIITFPKNTPPYRQIAPYFQDERVLASKMTSSNSLYAIINLLIEGFGISAIPTVTIQREIASGLLAPIKVTKAFPPMPIVGTYQSSVHPDVTNLVVEQARAAARGYCELVDYKTAWTI